MCIFTLLCSAIPLSNKIPSTPLVLIWLLVLLSVTVLSSFLLHCLFVRPGEKIAPIVWIGIKSCASVNSLGF